MSERTPQTTEQTRYSDQLMLDIKQVAKLLNVSVRTIARMRAKGWLPQPLRIGGTVRWRRDIIEDWVAADCPKPEAGGSSL